MRFAPESRPFLAVTAILTLPAWWLWGLPGLLLVLFVFLFILFFFRDPRREIPSGDGLVLSPADGRVVNLATVDDPRFPGGKATRVSIFLSLFDVHVNRAPVSGVVEKVSYSRGRFRAAFHGKASEENERNRLDIGTDRGPISVTQIAGAVARRIVCDVRPGDLLTAGHRFGLIRFGSRVDLFLPTDAQFQVRKGDRVRASASVLARLPEARAAAGQNEMAGGQR